MIDTNIKLILSMDPNGGCGVFTKGDSEEGRRLAEELYAFVREDVKALFRKAGGFRGQDGKGRELVS